YETADYRAVVSGFSPSLDSLTIYPRSSVAVAGFSFNGQNEKRRSRWSIGLQAGYGFTPRGPQPYLGVGVTFRIL
ncbi:MAG: hypothetical protein K2F79_00025, partial [Muribaculaceae bacterium]|nr:hypothetical protein [Muribaculaceae bacterium]